MPTTTVRETDSLDEEDPIDIRNQMEEQKNYGGQDDIAENNEAQE